MFNSELKGEIRELRCRLEHLERVGASNPRMYIKSAPQKTKALGWQQAPQVSGFSNQPAGGYPTQPAFASPFSGGQSHIADIPLADAIEAILDHLKLELHLEPEKTIARKVTARGKK